MAIVHQSDLASWTRCPMAFNLQRQGVPRRQLSATAYGSVMHHALETYERMVWSEGATVQAATDAAIATFCYFWHPTQIDAICDPVDVWLPRQSYSDLRARGIEAIGLYATAASADDSRLLATEFGFAVPIEGTWDEDLQEPHVLAGTIDRLALRRQRGKPLVSIEDFKTGKEQTYLRHNQQFSAYAYASTRPEFWSGWRGEDGFGEAGAALYERFKDLPRKGTWINMRTVKRQDAGWRGPLDYQRFALAVQQLVASWKADIYPMSMSGDTCQFCDYAPVCAGTGIPDHDHGAPL